MKISWASNAPCTAQQPLVTVSLTQHAASSACLRKTTQRQDHTKLSSTARPVLQPCCPSTSSATIRWHRVCAAPAPSARTCVCAAAAISTDIELDDYAADNFYQILGVSENASRRDIKRAYKVSSQAIHVHQSCWCSLFYSQAEVL